MQDNGEPAAENVPKMLILVGKAPDITAFLLIDSVGTGRFACFYHTRHYALRPLIPLICLKWKLRGVDEDRGALKTGTHRHGASATTLGVDLTAWEAH